MPCKGDASQSCGGAKSLDLYVRGGSPKVDSACKRTPAAAFNGNVAAGSPDVPGKTSPTSQAGLTRTTSVDASGQTSVFFTSDPGAAAEGSAARSFSPFLSLLSLACFVSVLLL